MANIRAATDTASQSRLTLDTRKLKYISSGPCFHPTSKNVRFKSPALNRFSGFSREAFLAKGLWLCRFFVLVVILVLCNLKILLGCLYCVVMENFKVQKSTESLENVQGKKLVIIFSTNSRTVFRSCCYYYVYESMKLHR